MDEANQAEKPVRRVGRPRKAVEGAEVLSTVEEFIAPLGNATRTLEVTPAQVFAKRVWDAQCHTEPRAWRLERVAEAMRNKGLSMEGVVL